jgi:AI-2 transport protein TqsA
MSNGASSAEAREQEHDQDWLGQFHLYAFLSLTQADDEIERRELVWVKRYFEHRNRGHLYSVLLELLKAAEDEDAPSVTEIPPRLTDRAMEQLSNAEKRRCVYNMAQMCKSKGVINPKEYEQILLIAEKVGVSDTDADAIINSVFSINDTFMAIVGLLCLGVILFYTQVVIVPLVIAVFITMIINKVADLLGAVPGLNRLGWLNKISAMVLILGTLFAIVMAAVASGKDIATRFPYYEDKIGAALIEVERAADAQGLPRVDWSALPAQLQKLPVGKTVSAFLSSLATLVGNFLLVVIFTGFLVFSTSRFTGIMQEMNDKISGYISIKAVSSVITGIAVYALCTAFGVDFALFWAILSFLLNFIPSVGSIIATAPPILLSMVQLDSWSKVIVFAVVFIVVQVMIGQIIEPKMMGSRLAIKPVAILLGLIFWGFLWGIPGMFLAAPLMALLRILSSYFNFSRSFERLLATD